MRKMTDPQPSLQHRHAAPRRGLGTFATVVLAATTAAVVGGVAGLGGYLIGQRGDGEQVSAPAPAPQVIEPIVLAEDGRSVAGIAAQVLPSVVSIVLEGGDVSGSGSGFVVQSDGYILTNDHVVAGAGESGRVSVVFQDGQRISGTVIGRSSSYDLAVVRVERTDMPAVDIGDSSLVRVGDPAIAIGAPLGLEGTVTAGIVSARDRAVTVGGTGETAYINAIQTDAAINPGNSGGPLLNGLGQVIGVNSAIATLAIGGAAGSIGLGFAIPINSAQRIAEEIIATGESKTPIIGVTLDMAFGGSGARIREVTPQGPSDASGLRPGDIITELQGRTIEDATELVVAIRNFAPGERVALVYDRNGQVREAFVVLGSS
jgi:putative serine protease PepD